MRKFKNIKSNSERMTGGEFQRILGCESSLFCSVVRSEIIQKERFRIPEFPTYYFYPVSAVEQCIEERRQKALKELAFWNRAMDRLDEFLEQERKNETHHQKQ